VTHLNSFIGGDRHPIALAELNPGEVVLDLRLRKRFGCSNPGGRFAVSDEWREDKDDLGRFIAPEGLQDSLSSTAKMDFDFWWRK
jgi:hypothetical protein